MEDIKNALLFVKIPNDLQWLRRAQPAGELLLDNTISPRSSPVIAGLPAPLPSLNPSLNSSWVIL